MSKSEKTSLARRGFLKGATAGTAAIVAQTSVAMAQQVGPTVAAARILSAGPTRLWDFQSITSTSERRAAPASARAYHEERMYIQMWGNKFDRGIDRADIGTALSSPNIDYASIAKGYGLYAEGPIADPKGLAPAIRRALERVKKGEPALLDVVTQPR